MPAPPEDYFAEHYFPPDYRTARRAFIAACEAAGADVIARVHPKAKGPDGQPLFLDSVALGARDATKGLLLISGCDWHRARAGSALQTALVRGGLARRIPKDARMVLLHALDPFGFAWGKENPDPDWPLAMLDRVAGEDLARVGRLVVLGADGTGPEGRALAAALPHTGLTFQALAESSGARGESGAALARAHAAVMAAVAGL